MCPSCNKESCPHSFRFRARAIAAAAAPRVKARRDYASKNLHAVAAREADALAAGARAVAGYAKC